MVSDLHKRSIAIGLMAIPLALAAHATDAGTSQASTAPSNFTKPAWLTELSLGVKETFDDNVFVAGAKNPPPATPPSGSVLAVRGHSSWITTVSPKVALNLASLLGSDAVLKRLSLEYAPDFVSYHDASSESFNAHRVHAAAKGKAEAVSFSFDNSFTYIDGDRNAPVYPGSQLNAYGTAMLRERREQFQDRANVSVQFDHEKWFTRFTGSLLFYELLTAQRASPGYQNYADRYDLNGGADVGLRLLPQLALTAGYRYGRQYQEAVLGTTLSSSSDYHRMLLGLEGKPWKWLTVAIAFGPDFRSYETSAPVPDHDTVTHYGEASLTARLSEKDTLAFKYKQFQWVSSTGRVPYFDSSHTLSYNHKVTSQLLWDVSGRILSSDYTSGQTAIGGPRNLRDDWMYSASTGLACTFNSHMSATLTYSIDLGRNNQDKLDNAITAQEQREFTRHLISCGFTVKF